MAMGVISFLFIICFQIYGEYLLSYVLGENYLALAYLIPFMIIWGLSFGFINILSLIPISSGHPNLLPMPKILFSILNVMTTIFSLVYLDLKSMILFSIVLNILYSIWLFFVGRNKYYRRWNKVYLAEKLLSIIAVMFILILVLKSVKIFKTIINPLALYFIFIIIDIYAPILIASDYFHISTLLYNIPNSTYLKSLSYTFVGLLFFAVGFFYIHSKIDIDIKHNFNLVNLKPVYTLLIFFLSIYFYLIYILISDFTSILSWVETSTNTRWAANRSNNNNNFILLILSPLRILIFILIGIIFKNKKEFSFFTFFPNTFRIFNISNVFF